MSDTLKGFHKTGEYKTGAPAPSYGGPRPELRPPRRDCMSRDGEEALKGHPGPTFRRILPRQDDEPIKW
jgi:hypothetical protein